MGKETLPEKKEKKGKEKKGARRVSKLQTGGKERQKQLFGPKEMPKKGEKKGLPKREKVE